MKREHYDTCDDKEGIVERIRQECNRMRPIRRTEGFGINPVEIGVKIALESRPIRTAQDMLRYGQTVYNCVHRINFYSAPMDIVAEIKRQARVELIRARDARHGLYTHPYDKGKARGFRAAHYTEKDKLARLWDVATLAIAYGANQDNYWLVKKLVDSSFPTKCFTCNGPLGRWTSASLYPVDTLDWKLLCEAADNNQLELRCFCNWKCQHNDRSEQWYLKEAKQKFKKLKKLLKQTQGVSS